MKTNRIFRTARIFTSTVIAGVLMASAAQAQVSNKKPADWPAKYTWYDYSQTAPQPVYNGKVKFIDKKGWEEAVNFDTLPLQHAIVRIRGNGSRKIAIFADPSCPHSRTLERNINKLTDVTIYTFVVPVLKNSKARPLSEQVLCQPTNQARVQAYDDLMLNNFKPTVVASCANSINQVLKSTEGLISPVDGFHYGRTTPTLVFDNNVVASGAQSLKEVRELMAEE